MHKNINDLKKNCDQKSVYFRPFFDYESDRARVALHARVVFFSSWKLQVIQQVERMCFRVFQQISLADAYSFLSTRFSTF